jgi:serine protease inhibitor
MRRLPLLLVLALTLAACGGAGGPGATARSTPGGAVAQPTAQPTPGAVGEPIAQRPPPDTLDGRLVAANSDFGMRLFKQVAAQEGTANIFLSPASVALALHMTYNGSAGKTREAMAQALGLQGLSLEELNSANADLLALLASPDPKVQLAIANSLWARQGIGFKPDFLERNRGFYQAEVTELNFDDPAASKTINGWVEQKTNGLIKQIVEAQIDPLTIMFLINAIYFKGTWSTEFDPKLTHDVPFTLADGSTIQRPMMLREDKVRYLKGDGFRAVALPYGAGRVSMYLFLPDAESSLSRFVSALDAQRWDQWMGQFQEDEKTVQLPRFKLEYEISLNDALVALGMGAAFDSGQADFSELVDVPAYISEVKHKSVVEVNEEGTEAAAVTSVRASTTSVNLEGTITFDRPFFFAIRDDKTGAVLFMGTLADPQ